MSDNELLTAKQAAAFLGITKPTLYAAIAAGRLPRAVYPTPRSPRWIKGDLIATLRSTQQSPTESNVARHQARMARLRAAAAHENDTAAD